MLFRFVFWLLAIFPFNSADALVMCRPTRRWCVGQHVGGVSANTLADALVGSVSLPLPFRINFTKTGIKNFNERQNRPHIATYAPKSA